MNYIMKYKTSNTRKNNNKRVFIYVLFLYLVVMANYKKKEINDTINFWLVKFRI